MGRKVMSSRGRGRNTIKDAQVQDGRLHGSNRQPITLIARAAYAASRISSTLKGTTKQFGWLQASATKVFIDLQKAAKSASFPTQLPFWTAAFAFVCNFAS